MRRPRPIEHDFIEWQRAEAVAEHIVECAIEFIKKKRHLIAWLGQLNDPPVIADSSYEILCAAYLIAGGEDVR